MTRIKKICEGCTTIRLIREQARRGSLSSSLTICLLVRNKKEEECPCTICLVKPICTRGCQERRDLAARLRNRDFS